jgi:hypothetical protein
MPAPPADANCLLLNPQLGWQINHAGETSEFMKFPDTMDTNVCNDSTFVTCSGGQHPKIDEVNCIMCRLNKLMPNGMSNRRPGHVNWFPATYTGKVCFHDFNFPDMDYTFSLQPEGKSGNGLTRWNPPAEPDPAKKGIPKKNCDDGAGPNSECSPKAFHIEFDSRETVERFRSFEWTKFRNDASPCNIQLSSCHPDEARKDVSLKRAVVIGLFGLDAEHNIYSELHPVYAIAIEMEKKVNGNVGESTWMIFARNTGDEGACSLGLHSLYGPTDGPDGARIPLEKLKLLIPPPEGMRATGASYVAGTEFYSNNASCPTATFYDRLFRPEAAGAAEYSQNNQGVLLDFDLKECGGGCTPLVEGTLHIRWDVVPVSQPFMLVQEQDECISLEEFEREDSHRYDRPTKEQASKLNDLITRARAESLTMRAADCPYQGRIESATPQSACTNLLTENREPSGSAFALAFRRGPYQDIINILGGK